MKKVIASLSFMLVISIVLLLQPTFANDGNNSNIGGSSEEVQFKEDLANKKYNRLLEFWSKDLGYVSDTKADFPLFYGGAYVDSNKNLVIQVTENSDSTQSYFKSIIGDESDVLYETVDYSYNTLINEHDTISDYFLAKTGEESPFDISAVGLSSKMNSVTVHIVCDEPSTHAIDEELKWISDNITEFRNIVIIPSKSSIIPAGNVNLGTKISPYNIYKYRSVGFWATKGTKYGIVTAPHDSSLYSNGSTLYINSTPFGTCSTPYFSGSVDAVFVERTVSSFTPSRSVSGAGFSIASGSYIVPAEGSTTYSCGVTSSYQTGTIQEVNVTVSYGITDCVITSATCEGGDSGGVVAAGGTSSTRYLTGIITGHTNDNNYQVYVKAGNIISTLGISIY